MNDLEVKVGQVWVGQMTGGRYTVTSVSDESVAVIWGGEYTSKISKVGLLRGFSLEDDSVCETDDNNEDGKTTITLRDHFAGLAMNKIISTSSNYDDIAGESYKIADAMLKARG